jgi:chemotaxis protein CheD
MLFEKEACIRGTYLKEYQAKIFGGSNMLKNSTLHEHDQIGAKNIEAVKKKLLEFSIPLVVEHVGSEGFRRIAFDVYSGDVWVHHGQM